MEIAWMLMKQVIMMLCLLSVGYYSFRKHWINEEGSRQLSNLLLQIVMPVLIVVSYQIEFSLYKAAELGIALLLSVISLVLAIVVSNVMMKKKDGVLLFGAMFSNASFFAVPIVQATFGTASVFYLSAYLMAFNVLSWTYGVMVISEGNEKLSFKQAFGNPGSIGVIVGLLVFVSPVPLPGIVSGALQHIANLNTPLAMIVFGVSLAQVKLSSIGKDKALWHVASLRLLLIPLITLVVFMAIPQTYEAIKLSILVAASAPVAISSIMFARKYDQDSIVATKAVGLTTVLSVISIPMIVLLSQFVW